MLVSSSVDSGFFSMDDRHTAGKTSDLGWGRGGRGGVQPKSGDTELWGQLHWMEPSRKVSTPEPAGGRAALCPIVGERRANRKEPD